MMSDVDRVQGMLRPVSYYYPWLSEAMAWPREICGSEAHEAMRTGGARCAKNGRTSLHNFLDHRRLDKSAKGVAKKGSQSQSMCYGGGTCG